MYHARRVQNSGNYAFYFDTITLVAGPPEPTEPRIPEPPLPPAADYRDDVPDDRIFDDWLEDEEKKYFGPGIPVFFYEGFSQYGPNGEVIYDFNNTAGLDEDEEDVLRRMLRLMREQAEQAEQAGQAEGSDAPNASTGAE